MPRELSTELETASESAKLSPIALVEILFDSGAFRVWTGWGPLVWGTVTTLTPAQRIIPGGIGIDETTGDETIIPGSLGIDQNAYASSDKIWYGVGNLGTVGSIEETTEVRAVGLEIGLSGIPTTVLDIALAEDWQGRDVNLYLGVLDAQGQIDGEPVLLFGGKTDRMVMTEGQIASIALTCESEMIDLERVPARRYTPDDQRAVYAGDEFCDYVASLQEVDINWGVSA